MVKKLGLFSIMILMFLNLVSCSRGSYRMTIGGLHFSQNKMTGSYSRFTGNCFKMVKIKEGEILKVTFSAVTDRGEISSNIVDQEGNTIMTLFSGDTMTIVKKGTYKLQVLGKKHRGSFLLSWEIKKMEH